MEVRKRIVARNRGYLTDAWDNLVRSVSWFYDNLAYELQTVCHFLCFPSRSDEPPQGQSNHHLLVLMKSIEYQIQERIASFPISEDTLLDWNMALMINASRRTDSIPIGEIWLDEDGNPIPYNDGIVAEYPRM